MAGATPHPLPATMLHRLNGIRGYVAASMLALASSASASAQVLVCCGKRVLPLSAQPVWAQHLWRTRPSCQFHNPLALTLLP
jgi:hypothetical protein